MSFSKIFWGFIFFLIVAILVGTVLLSLCWNEVMPYLFDLPTIDFWKAFFLSILIATIGNLLKGVNFNAEVKK